MTRPKMTREARANLIFLAIFLVVSIPGAIILVRKKMDPLSRPMWIPDGRLTRLVYIDPTDAPPTMPRMAPAITSAWVADEARARFGITIVPMLLMEDGSTTPVISDSRYFQLLGTKRIGSSFTIHLLVWNLPRGSGTPDVSITRLLNPTDQSSRMPVPFTIQPAQIPADVKRDLQDSGFPKPPQHVLWMEATLTDAPTATELKLLFNGTMDQQPFSDTLTIRAD